MVKIPNEALIIGFSLLVALVLSKSRGNSPVPFINPFSNLLGKAEAQAIEKLGSNIETLGSVKESNLGIAQSILDYERNIADVKISQQQTQLDKTQQYIGEQQRVGAAGGFAELAPKGDWQSAAQALLGKISRTQGGESVFPDFRLIANQQNYNIISKQAQYEIAQQNIATAQTAALKQTNEIQRLTDVYENTYGEISRYS